MKVIELRNVSHRNKGAELMFHAMVQHFAERDVRLVANHRVGTKAQLARHDVGRVAAHQDGRRTLVPPAGLPPRFVWNALKFTHPGEVDVVLDGAGFAYGDSWGAAKTRGAVRYHRWVRRQGGRVVLMPQSFGPFERADVRDAAVALLKEADLVFARDNTAMRWVEDLSTGACDVVQCPDFTPLVATPEVGDVRLPERPAAIIPNRKMIQRTSASADDYVELLVRVIGLLRGAGLTPFLLPHATFDYELATTVQERAGGNLMRVEEPDALRLKAIIGRCDAVLCSRFHGLVSALSQGVPAVATGWSHKYEHLLDEYGCPDALVRPGMSDAELAERVAGVVGVTVRAGNAERLRQRARWNKDQALAMWSRIDALLEQA